MKILFRPLIAFRLFVLPLIFFPLLILWLNPLFVLLLTPSKASKVAWAAGNNQVNDFRDLVDLPVDIELINTTATIGQLTEQVRKGEYDAAIVLDKNMDSLLVHGEQVHVDVMVGEKLGILSDLRRQIKLYADRVRDYRLERLSIGAKTVEPFDVEETELVSPIEIAQRKMKEGMSLVGILLNLLLSAFAFTGVLRAAARVSLSQPEATLRYVGVVSGIAGASSALLLLAGFLIGINVFASAELGASIAALTTYLTIWQLLLMLFYVSLLSAITAMAAAFLHTKQLL